MHDLTDFQRELLYVIASSEELNGLAIKDELETYYETTVNHGQLYPNLDITVAQGFVKKEQVDGRTNSYALTERGRRELVARREWEHQYFSNSS